MKNGGFLLPVRVSVPKTSPGFIKSLLVKALAASCAKGDADAMLRLSKAFAAAGEEDFYKCAANFWLYRAYQWGNAEAETALEQLFNKNGSAPLPSPIREDLSGVYRGDVLNALGFSFFDPKESEYHIRSADEKGVYLVSAFFGYEEADSDGFGMEICYDWWYLDGCLNYYRSFGNFHFFSNLDKRCNESRFIELRDKVAQKGIFLHKTHLQ